jgi:subtilisin family serine protease
LPDAPDFSDQDEVRLFGNDPGSSLADVYRPESGTYVHYYLPRLSEDLDGSGQTIAIIDSGVLSHHPDIRPRLIEAVDFTGEGTEDQIGHGTKVALVLAAYAPAARFVSLKVIGSGRAEAQSLISAIDWLIESPLVRVANMSTGVYRPLCKANCPVCQAAQRAAQAGCILTVAAGNQPGLTACPAKATDSVIAIAAIDPRTQLLAEYSSRSGLGGFAAQTPRPAIEWVSGDA